MDESDSLGNGAKYYLLALVKRDRPKGVFEHIGRYENTLAQRGLCDTPCTRTRLCARTRTTRL